MGWMIEVVERRMSGNADLFKRIGSDIERNGRRD
jgi:hypothetical protein